MFDLTRKVALVTGAGSERGLGRAIATRLAREGADVAVNDVTRIPYGPGVSGWGGVDQVTDEIAALGCGSMTVLADVSNAVQVDAKVAQVLERFGHIDILINNAGSRPGPDRVPVVELTEEAFDEVQRVNVKGTFLVSRAVTRHMLERGGGGKIVTIASVAGKRGVARYAAYSASKFALIGFTQSLANEVGRSRINVNAICPALLPTERAMYIAEAVRPEGTTAEDEFIAMVDQRAAISPKGRVTEVDDVANLAAFLSSAESDHMTGLAITVSGGEVMF